MRKLFKYGLISFQGAKVGDPVRYLDAPVRGQTGVILAPRGSHEVNAMLVSVVSNLGYVELKPQTSLSASAESGSASGIHIGLPVKIGGSLKIS